MDKPTSITSRN